MYIMKSVSIFAQEKSKVRHMCLQVDDIQMLHITISYL